MNTTRRCHYLPQFYLSNFADENGKIVVYYKNENSSNPIIRTPINTCVERDLYNLRKDDGEIDDGLEKDVLAPIESEASLVIKDILFKDKRLTDDMVLKLALFVAVMLVRTPKSIEAAKELGKAIQLNHIKELGEKPKEIEYFLEEARKKDGKFSDITVGKVLDDIKNFEEKYAIEMGKTAATGLSFSVTFELFRVLLKMNWCLCRAPSNSYFITSDAPAVCFLKCADGSAKFGGGLGLKNAELTFPLSPNKCIHLNWNHNQKYRAISKVFLKEVNNRTAWAAYKMIISQKESKHFKKLTEWASQSLEHPLIDTKRVIDGHKALKRSNRLKR